MLRAPAPNRAERRGSPFLTPARRWEGRRITRRKLCPNWPLSMELSLPNRSVRRGFHVGGRVLASSHFSQRADSIFQGSRHFIRGDLKQHVRFGVGLKSNGGDQRLSRANTFGSICEARFPGDSVCVQHGQNSSKKCSEFRRAPVSCAEPARGNRFCALELSFKSYRRATPPTEKFVAGGTRKLTCWFSGNDQNRCWE